MKNVESYTSRVTRTISDLAKVTIREPAKGFVTVEARHDKIVLLDQTSRELWESLKIQIDEAFKIHDRNEDV